MFQKKQIGFRLLLLCCCFTLAMGVMPVSAAPGSDSSTFGIYKVYCDGKQVYKSSEITAGDLKVEYGFVKATEADLSKSVDIYAALYDKAGILKYAAMRNVSVAEAVVDGVDLPITLDGITVSQEDAGNISRLTVFVWEHDTLATVAPPYNLGTSMVDYDFALSSKTDAQDGMDFYYIAPVKNMGTQTEEWVTGLESSSLFSRPGRDALQEGEEASDVATSFRAYYDSHPGTVGFCPKNDNYALYLQYTVPSKKINYVEVTGLGRDRDPSISNRFHLADRITLKYTDGTTAILGPNDPNRHQYVEQRSESWAETGWFRGVTGFTNPNPDKEVQEIYVAWFNSWQNDVKPSGYMNWATHWMVGGFPCSEYGCAYARFVQVAFY